MNYTQEEIQLAKEWKELAEEYNLTMLELHELVVYYKRMRELLTREDGA